MPQPRAKAKPVTLADLSSEDRKRILEQAREESKRNPTDVEGYSELSDREKKVRSLMDARDHARGCPVQTGERLGRVEGYDSRKPPRPDLGEPEKYIGVIRCMECGGTTVLDDPIETIDEAVRRVELTPAGVAAEAEPEPDTKDTEL